MKWRVVGAAVRELGWLGAFTALLVGLPLLGAAVLTASTNTWLPWFEGPGAGAPLRFVGTAIVLAAASLVPTYAVALAGGYLYGGLGGTLLALLAVTGAAWLGRAAMLPLAGEALVGFVTARPRAHAAYVVLLGTTLGTATAVVTLVRLAPVTPFAGTNLLMAAARVPAAPYLVGTVLGLAPRTALVATAGAGLAELHLGRGDGVLALWATVVGLLIAVLGLGWLARRRLGVIAQMAERLEQTLPERPAIRPGAPP
jgi:uncharacterized membrane protein YdjX (TVP38/TMEM64 family)